MLYKVGLKLSKSTEVRVKHKFILGLKKFIVVEIYFTNIHKQKRKRKQANKKKEKKSKPSLY